MIDRYTYSKKEVIKADILDRIQRLRSKNKGCSMLSFGESYHSWQEAESKIQQGYASEVIFDKVKKSAMAVRDGKGCFERDGYLFQHHETNFPVLAILLSLYCEQGNVRVLDFGGSLGSMYYQHKNTLERLGSSLSWSVVEQPHFVKIGKNDFSNEQLKFEYTIQDVEECNVVIFGSSLQYIENWKEYLIEAMERCPTYIIIDKTPVSASSWISIEHVHEPIYEANYPMWIFDRQKLLHLLGKYHYDFVEMWEPEYGTDFRVGNRRCVFESLLFKIRE